MKATRAVFGKAIVGSLGLVLGSLFVPPQVPSVEYSHADVILTARDGTFLGHGQLGPGAPHLVEPSSALKAVVIQSEDGGFRSHYGVSVLGLARSAKGIVTGRNLGGGSTLTMQLARLLECLSRRS
jgi:penicillin-binding protein 1A